MTFESKPDEAAKLTMKKRILWVGAGGRERSNVLTGERTESVWQEVGLERMVGTAPSGLYGPH